MEKYQYIKNISLDDISSFQTGVDTIYNGCKTYGSTPTESTPAAIVNAIKAIYTNRYNAGYSNGSVLSKINSITSKFYRDYKGDGSTVTGLTIGKQYLFIWAPRTNPGYTISFTGATIDAEALLTDPSYGRGIWIYAITATATSVTANSSNGKLNTADGALLYLEFK